jgi:hypothetical protein
MIASTYVSPTCDFPGENFIKPSGTGNLSIDFLKYFFFKLKKITSKRNFGIFT